MAFEATLRNRRLTENPTTITISGTAAENSSALAKGLYSVTSDVDCYILQGDGTQSATTSSTPLWSKERAEIEVRMDNDKDAYISVIQASSGGTLYITPVKA